MRRISGLSRFTHSRLARGLRLLAVVGLVLAASVHAILDRLVHKAHWLALKGESRRKVDSALPMPTT